MIEEMKRKFSISLRRGGPSDGVEPGDADALEAAGCRRPGSGRKAGAQEARSAGAGCAQERDRRSISLWINAVFSPLFRPPAEDPELNPDPAGRTQKLRMFG